MSNKLPKSWCVKSTFPLPKFKIVIDFLNKNYGSKYEGTADCYYGVSIDNEPNYFPKVEKFGKDCVLLTVDEFINLINNKISFTYEFFIEAFKEANDKIKSKIRENVDLFELTTTEDFILEMYDDLSVCDNWRNKLAKEFPNIIKKDVKVKISPSFGIINEKNNNESIIDVRVGGEYKYKAFVLNTEYDWEIKKDKYGYLLLVPNYKKN